MEALIWLENAILRLIFANSNVTNLLCRIFIKCARHSSNPESTMGQPWLGPEKNF